MRNGIKKGLVGLLGVGALALGMGGDVKGGMLTITNDSTGSENNFKLIHYSAATVLVQREMETSIGGLGSLRC